MCTVDPERDLLDRNVRIGFPTDQADDIITAKVTQLNLRIILYMTSSNSCVLFTTFKSASVVSFVCLLATKSAVGLLGN